MENSIKIVGNTTTLTERGKTVTFKLAHQVSSTSKTETDFIPCVAFNDKAKDILANVGKGDLVQVIGRLRYTSKQEDGKWINRTEVQVFEYTILHKRAATEPSLVTPAPAG